MKLVNHILNGLLYEMFAQLKIGDILTDTGQFG